MLAGPVTAGPTQSVCLVLEDKNMNRGRGKEAEYGGWMKKERQFSRHWGILGLGILTLSMVHARIIHVSPDGAATGDGSAGAPLASVQSALDRAQAGDVVLLAPGVYTEIVTTARGGSPEAPLVIDGQGKAVLWSLTLAHPHVHVQNLTLSGMTNRYRALLYFERGAHYCVASNNIIDPAFTRDVYAVSWRGPATKPFGADAASYNLLISNVIRRSIGNPMVTVMGDGNVIYGNRLLDGAVVDFFRLFGRSNIIAANLCSNNFPLPGVNNHPDFIQTFGNNGHGSMGHVIDGNWVIGVWSGQLTQLSSDRLSDVIRDWTFRNNVFIDIALQASCTIPEVKYFNNLFLRCNTTNGGHALNFGSRGYDISNAPPGSLVAGLEYVVRTNGSGDGTGYIVYEGRPYRAGERFVANAEREYVAVGDAVVWLRLYDSAHGALVFNNVFIDCGDARTNVGWYGFATNLVNVAADYNFVAKSGFKPVRIDPQMRPVGDPRGWDWVSMYWWEPHGINGGDPGFVDLAAWRFELMPESPLVGAGTNLSKWFQTDALGRRRAGVWDIGPYAAVTTTRPVPPSGLRIVK